MTPDAQTNPAPPPHHVAALDGVRALAVLGVMAIHAGTPGSQLGWLGVDVFFALSGFLITTLLVREHAKTGTVSVWRFWVRRVLRLMPAYWLYLAAMTTLMFGGVGTLVAHGGWTPGQYVAALWGYYVNYAPLGGIWKHQMLTIHLWSLAVEEQFYLVWPVACWLLLKARRGPEWAALFSWGLVAGVIVYRHSVPDQRLVPLLPTRGLAIIVGAAAALTCASGFGVRRRGVLAVRPLRVAVVGAVAVIVATFTVLELRGRVDKLYVHRYAVPPLDFLFALAIAMLWYGPRDRLARLLSVRPLAYLGRISYGLYLYHMAAWFLVWGPLLGRIERWPQFPKFGLRVTTFFALSILIATLSYYLLEGPFLRLKERVR